MKISSIASIALASATIAIGAYLYLGNRDEITAPTPETPPPSEIATPAPDSSTVPSYRQPDPTSSDSALDLETADRYDVVLAAAKPLADAGDPKALDTIARIFRYCQNYLASPQMYRETQEVVIGLRPADAEQLRAALGRVESRCELVNGGLPIKAEDTAEALSSAAAAGSYHALVREAITNPSHVTPKERSELALYAIRSSDPNLLLDAAVLLEGADNTLLNSIGLTTDPIDVLAVQVAACREGASCGRGSLIMDAMCLNGSNCSLGTFEDVVRTSFLTPANTETFAKKVAAVQKAIAANQR